MTFLANLGMLLIATGCAALIQSLWTPVPWPAVVLAFPGLIAVGVLCIRYRARRFQRIAQEWNEYESAARVSAEDFKNGKFTVTPPTRPNVVSGTLMQVTNPEPLDSWQKDDMIHNRVFQAVAMLLSPCGEAHTYLGCSNAVVSERGSQAELLQDAWVIDREWEDGRWTTEWLHVSIVGSRLRVVGGGGAFGARKAKDKSLTYQNKLLFLLGTPIFVCAAMLFPMLGILVWNSFMMAFILAFAIHELASAAFPVPMKASLSALNRHCVPSLAFRFVDPLVGDTSALKLRVVDAISSFNLPG